MGKAISSGKYIGTECKREGKIVDGVEYVSKCPFGTYYCCDMTRSRKRITAREKMATIQRWKKEVINISVAYPNLKGSTTTILEQILFAELELNFYNSDDFICAQVAPVGESQTRDRMLKSRVSSLSQRVNKILNSGISTNRKCF